MARLDLKTKKKAFEKFKQLELYWLISLPFSVKQLLRNGADHDEYLLSNLRMYGEFFLVLCELKPCAVISHYRWDDFGREIFRCVVEPVLEEFDLYEAGFCTFQISHSLQVQGCDWKNSYVLYNINDPNFELVKNTFLTPIPQAERISETLVGKALGYPTQIGSVGVDYFDADETHSANVTLLEYRACKGDESLIFRHYLKCVTAFRQIGVTLKIALSNV